MLWYFAQAIIIQKNIILRHRERPNAITVSIAFSDQDRIGREDNRLRETNKEVEKGVSISALKNTDIWKKYIHILAIA